MTKFRVTYSREYSKIVYARDKQEAMWKFNREADDNQDYISAEEVKDER